jgi:hypothetical protein
MGKTLHQDTGSLRATTLVTVGWLSFVCSFLISNPFAIMALQAIARVLPKPLGLRRG